MKNLTQKIISTAMSVSLAAGLAVFSSAEDINYGDISNDGQIDSTDALLALEHSIGKSVLPEDALTRADVDGNSEVNSSDALDILRYSTGLINRFAVSLDTEPQTGDEILAYYARTVKKAKDSRPEYLLATNSEFETVDIDIKDPFGVLKMAGTSASEMENTMKQSILNSGGSQSSLIPEDSYNSYSNLPALCTLTDSSKLKSISLTVLENGNYRIDIQLYDEKNPSAESPACQVLDASDYDTVLAQLKEEADIEGAEGMTSISLDELSYKNMSVTCEVNPLNDQLVSFDKTMDVYNVNSVGILTVKIKTVVYNTSILNYSNFTY